MDTISSPQAHFDDLVASSQSNMEHDHRNCNRIDLTTFQDSSSRCQQPRLDSLSIDHFLAYYRHEANTIRDFIACLDDHSECTGAESEIVGGFIPTSEALRQFSLPSTDRQHIQCNPSKRTSIEVSLDLEGNAVRKRTRSKLSMQEKEERRRNQNREAQRRFREKHMLLSSQDVSGRHLDQRNGRLTPLHSLDE